MIKQLSKEFSFSLNNSDSLVKFYSRTLSHSVNVIPVGVILTINICKLKFNNRKDAVTQSA